MTVPTTPAGDVDDTPESQYPTCPRCGDYMEWVECEAIGCEDGWIEAETLMEEDPLWYGPDDTERCEQCEGKGGWWWCANQACPGKKE